MSQDDSRIEKLKNKLYSKTEGIPPIETHDRLHSHSSLVRSSWGAAPEDEDPVFEYKPYTGSYNSLLKKLLWGSAIFFVIALAVAGYIFYQGTNVVSANNIDITLTGPVSVSSGDQLSLGIAVTNRNKADLTLADLIVNYPDGTRSVVDGVTPVASDRISIGTIGAGATIHKNVSALLFGQENSQETIKVTVEYGIGGSNTLFTKDKSYPLFIGSSPVSLSADSVKQVSSGQNVDLTLHVNSNSAAVVKSMVLKADYPFGFQYISADPAPATSNNFWLMGDIEPGGQRTIVIHGKMIGQDSQANIFNFNAGLAQANDSTVLGTSFVTTSAEVDISKPFLGADISLDGDGSPVHVVPAGTPIRGAIVWQNNLNVPVDNVSIEAHLTGAMLDQYSVNSQNGFYSSKDNSILWDQSTLPVLKEVQPGQTGTINFSFASLSPNSQNDAKFRQPSISLNLDVKGSRLNESNVPEAISSTVSRQVQISSGLTMSTELVRTVGPFVNTGPVPPQVSQNTTYTVLVTVYNSFNSVQNAVFTATLPAYVQWMGNINPVSPGVTFDSDNRQITWPLGGIAAGTGYGSAPKQFAFQMSLQASASQVNFSPIILNSQRIAGNDNYTGTVVDDIEPPLTTDTTLDPAYKDGDGKVVSGR